MEGVRRGRPSDSAAEERPRWDQKQWKPFLEQNKGKQILLYCASGGRSKTVAAALAEKGLRTANVGGFRDWSRAGLPVRQVE